MDGESETWTMAHTPDAMSREEADQADQVDQEDGDSESTSVPTSRSSILVRHAREKRIRVCVRIRPLTKRELMRSGGKAAWTWCVPIVPSALAPRSSPVVGVLTLLLD